MSDRFLPTVTSETDLPALRDAIWKAVEGATSVNDKSELDNKLDAYAKYLRRKEGVGRRTTASRDAQNFIAMARDWNERLLGELLREQPLPAGSRGQLHGRDGSGNAILVSPENYPTLAELGVSPKLSARAQKISLIPEGFFNRLIEENMYSDEPLTPMRLLREWKKVQKKEENEVLRQQGANVPEGTYETIVIDPPWDMKKIERDVRPNQVCFEYPTMSEDQLAEFPIPKISAPDCHLFCWTTQKFLPSAMRLIKEWGFRYVLSMVWHKPGGFQPIGLPQYNCEFVIYGRGGSPEFVDTKNFFCCFNAARREHSRKPDEFYDLIRRVTAGPRIDVFSREVRDGFDQYGNEIDKFSGDAAQ